MFGSPGLGMAPLIGKGIILLALISSSLLSNITGDSEGGGTDHLPCLLSSILGVECPVPDRCLSMGTDLTDKSSFECSENPITVRLLVPGTPCNASVGIPGNASKGGLSVSWGGSPSPLSEECKSEALSVNNGSIIPPPNDLWSASSTPCAAAVCD